MSDAKIEQYLGPILTIRDGRCSEAVDFYKSAFGAEEVARLPSENGAKILNVHLKVFASDLLLSDDFPEWNDGKHSPPPACVILHMQVEDADRAWTRALGAGANVKTPLENMPWGYRLGQLHDPFGHTWSIGSPKTT